MTARRLATLTATVVALALAANGIVGAAAASAAGTPRWAIQSIAAPRTFTPGDETGRDRFAVIISNAGSVNLGGPTAPATVTDKLPAGVEAISVEAEGEECSSLPATVVTCNWTSAFKIGGGTVAQLIVHVRVAADAESGRPNLVSVSGGGAPAASWSEPLSVGSAPAGPGVEQLGLAARNRDGSLDTQAGSHPYELSTFLNFNQTVDSEGHIKTEGLVKDVHVALPAGLLGNPSVIPQCSQEQFTTEEFGANTNKCPVGSVIGRANVLLGEGDHGFKLGGAAIDNLVPRRGEPARFGFRILGQSVYLDASVRTGGDYGVDVDVNNIPVAPPFSGSELRFWGVPSDPGHDPVRGICAFTGEGAECPDIGAPDVPFLTLPTSCSTQPLKTVATGDSWENPGVFGTPVESVYGQDEGKPSLLDGCGSLAFGPTIEVQPDGTAASTPTGLNVHIHVPQEEDLNPTGLAQANVKSTTLTLPAGLQVSPSAADGLLACSEAQVGLHNDEPVTCPEASKLALVHLKTPLLPNELTGEIYLAAQESNPFGSLLAQYLVAEDPVSGTLIKLAGKVTLDPVTGQLVSTFENTPQLPFEDLRIEFFGTARAPLTTPALCGSYTTTSSIEPWSGNPPATPPSSFPINTGPGGGPCQTPQPFAPLFHAHTSNIQAGAFTPFELTMSRPDADQPLSQIQMKMPPGLLGMLSSVKLCGEPQAQEGKCGPESLIGETIVSAGLGGDPYTVTGGKVYITTGSKGAPYGLSIVNPAKAGPFDLEANTPCDCIVVRSKIEVDPRSAQLTITSDPLPTILKGIPLQLQHVFVNINRPGFTFNGTDCNKLAVTGTLSSSEGATAGVESPFQVTNCAALKFEPKLTVSTGAHASKANGASLTFKIAYPKGAVGSQSWVNEAKFDLPKQLPSRLTTLQKACLAATFEANPASCPEHSLIGHAVVHTPVLPVPLEGPVYFVSYGGAQFPEAVLVLKGYGVTIDLHGETFISSKSVTSATFRNTPDVPFESIEVTLPTGPYSEFGTYLPHGSFNLCGQKLIMPTLFKASDGAEIHQNTTIGVTGCPPSLSISKTAIKANSLLVTVKLSEDGTLKITGRGLKNTTRKGLKAGTHTITIPLTATGRAAKRRHGKLKIKAALTVASRTGTATAALKT